MLLRRRLSLVLVIMAILKTGIAEAADEGVSFHGGVAIATLIIPTIQLQLESHSWFVGVEYGYGLGLGSWGLGQGLQL